ncbi:MAG: BPL-N domain-containing protein, partial [Gemmatimonadales bacterium]
GILSESASARLASPIFQELEDVEGQPERGIAYPNPWPGGWWRLRDIIDYQQIACRSLVGLAARQRRQLIHNYVEIGRRAVEAGRSEPPFAYIVPAAQRDVGSAIAMLRILQQGGVEIHRAGSRFEADGLGYAAGDWVVLMAQPYRAHAKDLLEPQEYPDLRLYPGGPPDAPYDAAGWTLPLQMGVQAIAVTSPFDAELELETEAVHPPTGTVSGSGSAYLVQNVTNAANLAIHRTLAGDGQVVLLTQPLEAGGQSWPIGSAVLSGPGVGDILGELAETHGLSASALSGRVTGTRLGGLRVGLYQPWTASMDEGWARWVFETWELPYGTLHDAEIRAGALEQRYDAIVLPDVSPRSIIDGRQPGTVPPEYAGGLGDVGVQALRDFVKAGGTLICIDSSTGFAIEQLGIAVDDVRPGPAEQRGGQAFYAPGSIMSVSIDPTHPLGYGMPERTAIYYSNGPLFGVAENATGVTVVASYPQAGQLLSGYAIKPEFMAGKAALVESRHGDGRVILFGFRPHYRGQSHETFKILFNAVYQSAAAPPQSQGF